MRTHKAVPVSMTDDLLAQTDERARSLGLSRSTYIQQLVRADLGLGSMTLNDAPSATPAPVPLRPVRYTGKKKRAG